MSAQPESPQPLHETNVSATTPLLESSGGEAKLEAGPLVITATTGGANSPAKTPSSPTKPASPAPAAAPASPTAAKTTEQPASERPVSQNANEYRFVHLRIPPRSGKLRFLLPILLLVFQLVFIILFAFFANYSPESNSAPNKYPMFVDLHAIAILGFGFIMTFLKRYGYGSIGFNLLLVAFVIQWALIVRGWLGWGKQSTLTFNVGIENLVYADFTAIAILVSFGAVLGTATLTQLIVMAVIEVVAQVFNEYLNIHVIKTYDVGRSVYVHLFGALFGRAVSKFLHFKGVSSTKQASVYHSDLFALIGTLFLFVYYPSFNGLLSHSLTSQTKAIVNTLAAICASCVATFGVSSLAGCGRLNVLHVQHATIAGGIAIGAVVDLNVQIYVALIVGAVAGFLSTIGYQYIEPFAHRVLKIHDSCGVVSLHGLPGLIAALLGAIFAACATFKEYGLDLYTIYPARLPSETSNEYFEQKLTGSGGLGRTGFEQAGFQLIGLVITAGIALVTGSLTGLLLRLPIFEQLSEDVEMFDDEAQWITPDDYALKLTFAAANNQAAAAPASPAPAAAAAEPAPAPQSPAEGKKEDSKV